MTDSSRDADSFTHCSPSAKEINDALDAVISSEVFANSPRLQEFLSYIVEETLGRRIENISAKSIAVDVYRRELVNDDGALNLVRVEARRLRRLLEDYYSSEGSTDPVRIQMALGGYRPSFETPSSVSIDSTQTEHEPARWINRKRLALLGAGFAVAILVAGNLSWVGTEKSPPSAEQIEMATLEAYRERSVPTLQAANLSQQARGLLFPLFDKKRQYLALEMFLYAIELEPNIPQGYAGAAQVYATLSAISQDQAEIAEYSKNALEMANQALDLDPSSAWAHGALAWTLGTGGDFKDALKHANLALKLAPEDGHVLDLVGIAAIISRDPELAALVSDPARPRSGVGRFGARNIWGVSQYMLGDYPAVIEAFGNAPAEGAPVSPPSLVFLAVAYDHLGKTAEAQQLVSELSATWPNFPTAFLVRRIFHPDSEHERDILHRLARNGYDPG